MVAVGHPAQRRQRLALGAGRDDHDPLVGEVGDLARPDEHPLGDLDVPEAAPDADVLAHRAPDERDLAAERLGGVDDLLDAVDVRREARHDDPPSQRANTSSRCGPTTDSDGEKPVAVDVRRVAAQQQHALAAELGQPRDVGRRAVDRGLVELVVAGDQHGAELGAERDRARVGDRVGHVHQLERERARARASRPASTSLQLDVAQLVLVELRARHRDRQRARRRPATSPLEPELAHHPRQRAEVVLVAVRDDDRLDVARALAQVGEVGQHEVDPDHLGRREAQPDVDDDDAAVVLDDRHVLADLAEPAERQDAQRRHRASVPRRRRGGRSPCGRALSSRGRAGEQAVAFEHRAHRRRLLGGRLARAAGAGRRLRARAGSARPSCRSGSTSGTASRRRPAARRRSPRGCSGSSTIRRISLPTMWLATLIPPAPPSSSVRSEAGVVARVEVEPVDRLQLVRVGLLDARDALDLRELGEQVGRDVGAGARRGCCRAGSVCRSPRPPLRSGASGRARLGRL